MADQPPEHETSMTSGIPMYPSSSAAAQARTSSQAGRDADVSSWGTVALVTAVLPVPILWLLSLGFAVAALRRGRRGTPGFGRAVAAVLVVPAWIGLVVLLLAAGADTATRDDSGDVVAGGDVAVERLAVGDCLPEAFGDEAVLTVPVVPCDESHRGEVYADLDLPDGDFPGIDEVIRLAEGACLKRFEDFVGERYDDSPHEMYYFHPVADSWSLDRGVTCIVETQGPVTGSLEGQGPDDAPSSDAPDDEDASRV